MTQSNRLIDRLRGYFELIEYTRDLNNMQHVIREIKVPFHTSIYRP